MNVIETKMTELGITAMAGDLTWTRYLNYPEQTLRADFSKGQQGYAGSLVIRQIADKKETWYLVQWIKVNRQSETLDSIYPKSADLLEEYATTIVSRLMMFLL